MGTVRKTAIEGGVLRDALDADGKKIVNLATPTQDADAATKEYVDSHAGGSPQWENIQNKPTSFPPSAHTHTVANITDFPSAMPPTAHTHPQSQVSGLGAALAAKRDLSNRQWGERTFSEWVLHSTEFPESTIWWFQTLEEYVEAFGIEGEWRGPGWYINKGVGPWYAFGGYDPFALIVGDDQTNFTRTETTDHLALDSETDAKLAGKLGTSDVVAPSPDATSGKAADAKATGDALDKKTDEFTEWDGVPVGGRLRYYGDNWWGFEAPRLDIPWYTYGTVQGGEDATTLGFEGLMEPYSPFTATRTKVLRTGDALTPGLDAQGVPTDPNVRDLFSKSDTFATDKHLKNSVLEESVNALIDAKVGDVNAVLAAALDGSEVA